MVNQHSKSVTKPTFELQPHLALTKYVFFQGHFITIFPTKIFTKPKLELQPDLALKQSIYQKGHVKSIIYKMAPSEPL